eukprot:Skav235276  [mRNA]  locus=scaffold874:324381:337616:+ [translate_table: standard]
MGDRAKRGTEFKDLSLPLPRNEKGGILITEDELKVAWEFFDTNGCPVLFKNSYQSGVFSIFYAIGRHPLYLWNSSVRNGHVRRLTDEDIGSAALEICGNNVSTTTVTCPEQERQTLGIKLPFLVLLVKNLNRYFAFEVEVMDDLGQKRRFKASNFHTGTKVLHEENFSRGTCGILLACHWSVDCAKLALTSANMLKQAPVHLLRRRFAADVEEDVLRDETGPVRKSVKNRDIESISSDCLAILLSYLKPSGRTKTSWCQTPMDVLNLEVPLGPTVGEGTSGTVQPLEQDTFGRFVVKRIKKAEDKQVLTEEVRLLKLASAECPHVLRFALAFETLNELLVITEACDLPLWDALVHAKEWQDQSLALLGLTERQVTLFIGLVWAVLIYSCALDIFSLEVLLEFQGPESARRFVADHVMSDL